MSTINTAVRAIAPYRVKRPETELATLGATVAPRVAKSVSGRFTLYGAMALTAVLIVLTTAFIIYLFATVAAPGLGA